MKKLVPIIFILGMLSLIIQFGIQALIKHHEVDYSIITDDNAYLINEKLNVEDGDHTYSFIVTDKKNNDIFYFDFVHNYNKQDNIIKDIKFFEDEKLTCIFPIYKKNFNGDIFCNYDGVQVSNSYLRQIDNENLNTVISKLKSSGYKFDTWNDLESTFESVDGKFNLYKENLPDDIVFTMWFYNGFYRISKDEFEVKTFLNDDRYDNDRSYVINDYMFVINTDDIGATGYFNFYIFDVANGGKVKLDFEEQVTDNMYFNGVYGNKLYYTDLGKKKQFSVHPKTNVVTEVGNVDLGFKTVKNNKLVDISAKDFLEENVYFEKEIVNDDLVKLYGAKEIKIDGDMYYFLSENGNFYKTFVDDVEHAILLFNFSSVSEWLVKDGNVMIVSEDMLYFYDDNGGLLPILQNSELKYNYKNICNFVVK